MTLPIVVATYPRRVPEEVEITCSYEEAKLISILLGRTTGGFAASLYNKLTNLVDEVEGIPPAGVRDRGERFLRERLVSINGFTL